MTDRKKERLQVWLLAAFTLAIFLFSFFLGRYTVRAGTTVSILLDRLLRGLSLGRLGLAKSWTDAEWAVIVQTRLPRVGAAALVGAALSAAGCAYQGMLRNPMVSPDLLGASTGAGFGAALAILLGCSYAAVTGVSFAAGLLAVAVSMLIARKARMDTALSTVLSGMMVSSLFSSATSFLKLSADPEAQLPAITYWLMGSLASVKLSDLRFAAVPVLLGLVPLFLLRWRLNLLTVSDAEGRSMGVNTSLLRGIVIVCATLATAGSVCVSGMIGWVGLVVPHLGRLLFGQDNRRLMPASMLLGAAFLMVTDDLARLVSTSEVPLGILTSFVGAPVFLWLIVKGGVRRAT